MFPTEKDLTEGLTLSFSEAIYKQVAAALKRGERPLYKAECEGVAYEASFDEALPDSRSLHLTLVTVEGKPVNR